MQQTSQQASSAQRIPTNIEALATTYALGAPHTKYRTQKERTTASFGLLWMIYLAILISVGFFFFISSSDRTWLTWFAWLFYLLILFFCIRLFIVTLLAPRIEVFLCTEGLIYSQKSRLEIIRWDQVAAFWEDISISHDSESSDTYNYRLQRSDGTQFKFPDNIVNVQALGERIKRQVNQQLFPQVMRTYHAGSSIAFGDIAINQHGISVEGGQKTLRWSEFEGIIAGEERLDIYRKGEQHPWYHQRISQLPNAGIFQGLVDHIVQELARQELSRVIVTYKMGATLTFGRIRLSQQGVAVDGGKKFLPMSEISRLHLETYFGGDQLTISKKGSIFTWQVLLASELGDVDLLQGLIEHIMEELSIP